MARNKLTRSQQKMVRELVMELTFAKKTQAEIIAIIEEKTAVHITQQQVSYYVNKGLAEKHENVERMRTEEISLAEWQRRELIGAWDDSKKPKKSTSKEVSRKKPSGKEDKDAGETQDQIKSGQKEEERVPDVRYQDALSRVSERICKLKGVNQDKVDLTLRGGVVIMPDNKRNPDGDGDTT